VLASTIGDLRRQLDGLPDSTQIHLAVCKPGKNQWGLIVPEFKEWKLGVILYPWQFDNGVNALIHDLEYELVEKRKAEIQQMQLLAERYGFVVVAPAEQPTQLLPYERLIHVAGGDKPTPHANGSDILTVPAIRT
jgi:hypothetical protein